MTRRPVAVLVVTILVGCVNATPPRASDIPVASPAREVAASERPTPAPEVIDPVGIETALRRAVPELSLEPWQDLEGLGVFPPLTFIDRNGRGRVPRVGRVLVFGSAEERGRLQSRFGASQIAGIHSTVSWDGPTHSEWLPARNVLVEVEMPGGMFGEVTPWTDPDEFLGLVRSALAGL